MSIVETSLTNEIVNHERIRPIPGTEEYTISDLGILRRTIDNSIVLPEVRQGYLVKSMVIDGKAKPVRLHRLVLSVFTGLPYDHYLVPNHINGHRHDNRLENLEWVTRKENTTGNSRVSTTNFPIDFWNIETNVTFSAANAREAAKTRIIPVSWETILAWLAFSNDTVHQDGWRVKRADEKWLELDHSKITKEMYKTGNCREVVAKNLSTNTDYIFGSQREAHEFTKVSEASISIDIKDNSQRLLKEKWVFKSLNTPWREFKSLIEEVKNSNITVKPVLCVMSDGTRTEFLSAADAAIATNSAKNSVLYNANVNLNNDKDNLTFNKYGFAFKFI